MPDWIITVVTIVATLGAAFGGLRAVMGGIKADLTNLVHKVDGVQITANETAGRLVKLETRLEAMDSLRFDERLRLLELALARAEGRYNANGETEK